MSQKNHMFGDSRELPKVDKVISLVDIERHQQIVDNCSTKWYVNVLVSEQSQVPVKNGVISKEIKTNHCNARDCVHCSDHRIGVIKRRIRPYFETAYRIGHVVLTVPNIDVSDLTKQRLNEERAKLKKFIRNINKNKRFYGFHLVEIKYQDQRGDWHLHWHIVFFNWTPHQKTIRRVWDKIQGQTCQIKVLYNSRKSKKETIRSKKALLNYFAKRSANAGLINNKIPLDTKTYLRLIYKTHMFSKFGHIPDSFWSKVSSILELLAKKEREEDAKYLKIRVLTLFNPGRDKDPPPDLEKRVLDALKLDGRFSVKDKTRTNSLKNETWIEIKYREITDYGAESFSPEWTVRDGKIVNTHSFNTRFLSNEDAQNLFNKFDGGSE